MTKELVKPFIDSGREVRITGRHGRIHGPGRIVWNKGSYASQDGIDLIKAGDTSADSIWLPHEIFHMEYVSTSAEKILTSILTSISTKKDIEIDYTDAAGAKTTRTITPKEVKILADAGESYVLATCHLRNDVRRFYIDRISDTREPKPKPKLVDVKVGEYVELESYGSVKLVRLVHDAAGRMFFTTLLPSDGGYWGRAVACGSYPYVLKGEDVADVLGTKNYKIVTAKVTVQR